jgi:hypothetical protein
MDLEELRAEIAAIVDPEPDPDLLVREIPNPRLRGSHGLDVSYLEATRWEGSTTHPHTRIWPADEERLHTLIRNADVPIRLFEAALRLFADSIIAYHDPRDRTGQLRYYPPIVLTFWSGFETFVRYSSELMLITVKDVHPAVAEFLRELDLVLDRGGNVQSRNRYQPVLDRYAALLKQAYHYDVNRGARHWQRLEAARALRDYYTHLDVTAPRSISTTQIIEFMEAVLLGIIWPSSEMRRTQLLGIHHLYWTWDSLRQLAGEYVEQPFLLEWQLGGSRDMFYCPFDAVDTDRFPNSAEDRL